jgi:trigger factor
MKVQVEEISPIERKLSIEVESAQVVKELERAYGVLSRQVKVPGFRPGKVPRRILEQRYKEQIEDDVVQSLVQKAYVDAIREHKVEAVSQPQITNPSGIRPPAPFSFEARVEVRPKVEPKDYEGLELTRQDVAVGEDKVDERIEAMRQRLARLDPVEGREVAQAGDWAQIDFTASIDGKPFPGSTASDITVEVTDGELIRGNVKQLEGTRVGEHKEVDYTFPEDYQVEEVRGKSARFDLHLKGLKQQVTPEVNDDLAKELGGGETLAELKTKVRGQLEKALRGQTEQKERAELLEKLVAKNPYEVPRAMVERAVDSMLRGALRSITQQGIDPRYLQLDFDKLREEMQPRAELEVKGTLLLEAIADKHELRVSDEDVEKKLEQLAEESNVPLSQVRKQLRESDAKEALAMKLREEKTIEFLKARAKYS